MDLSSFGIENIVLADFEFNGAAGDAPNPICMVAYETATNREHRVWEDELRARGRPPFSTAGDTLYVSYYSSAEIGCHLALGWPLPERTLDLFPEFRLLTNGRPHPMGAGLLAALNYFGIEGIDGAEKDAMRALVLRGGPWTAAERDAVLDYCRSDVVALRQLLPRMLPHIDLPRAFLRSRYMVAAARIENTGVPIDVPALERLRKYWAKSGDVTSESSIQDLLVSRVDREYGVFDGRTFKADRFATLIDRLGIAWPTTESGQLELDDDTFREMARAHPVLAPIRELRHTLSQMRLEDLAVGKDARNRVMLSAFQARTGRNQPSNSKFIFGPSVWLRSLIKPPPGHAVVYSDYSQQEFGIAGVLSGDSAMIEAYETGDPYLAFGRQSGVIPPDGTKESHSDLRDLCKACVLATQYAMGAESLAGRIGKPVAYARELLQLHRRTYATFWRWSDAALDHAMLHGRLWTVFGWTIHLGDEVSTAHAPKGSKGRRPTSPRSLRNFLMQGNGAEMLRLASIYATEGGVQVAAPVHDALLTVAPIDSLEDSVQATRRYMQDASAAVLDGFRLRVDPKIVSFPDRFSDKRGERMWRAVWELIAELERGGRP